MFMLSVFLLLSGAQYGWSGNCLSSMVPQPPMVMPSPVYQFWDDVMSVSSGQLHGNPSRMMSSQHSMFPSTEALNATYPSTVSHVLPTCLPANTNLQMPWSTCDDSWHHQWGNVETFFSLREPSESYSITWILNFSSHWKGQFEIKYISLT